MDAPRIVVTPPGPRAREVVEEDSRLIMQSFSRWYPLVVKEASGVVVEDVDGNRYLDFNSGLVVVNVGHRHPRVVEAVKRQVDKLIHYSLTDFYYEEAVRAARVLLEISPIEDGKVFYTNSGAESIEGAIKVARGHSRGSRPYIIAFLGAFHGRTMGAMSVSASKPVHRRGFYPLVPHIIHVPYPYTYRCPFGELEERECGEAVIGYIEEWVFKRLVDPSEVAAFLVEPIQGEGGYIVPPDNFLPLLQSLARRHGILLALDEVQTGFGRTGEWFAAQHWGVEPDLMAAAKGIAGGLPLGAIVGRREVMDLPPGSHANTFGGNPIALAAMMAVVEAIREEDMLSNARRVGGEIMKRLREMGEEIELIGDVRGKGLMIGVELVRDRSTKEPAKKELARVLEESFKRGLLVVGSGESVVRIAPPLSITMEQAMAGLDILEEVLRDVSRG
ncbi:MAG: acetyl ornithine aminotransferase family protein [Desulfurococcales archaeon]|nr:acetyl ornithine aminotransferase family protein [Desulfurococcales archaeon]MCE4604951.1 acetyl ornithine aminotransferase family protein [Desulfurococcales archaeon]